MFVNVREPFLDNAEESGFQFAVEPAKIGRNLDLDLDPGPLVETLGVAPQRAHEADFVEQGRMQKTGDGSNLRGAGRRQPTGLREHLPAAVRLQPGGLRTAEDYAQGGQE